MSNSTRDKLKKDILCIMVIEDRGDIWQWCYETGYDCDSSDLNEHMALLNDDELKKFMIETLVENIKLKD